MSARSRESPPSGRWEEPTSDQRLAPLWRRVLPAWNHISPDPSCFTAQPWLFCAALGLHNWLPKDRVVLCVYVCVLQVSLPSTHYYISLAINDCPERSSVLGDSLITNSLFCEHMTCSQIHRNIVSKSLNLPDSFSSAFLFLRQFWLSCTYIDPGINPSA